MRRVFLLLAFAAILGAAPISDWFLGNTLAASVWTVLTPLGGTAAQSSPPGVTIAAPSGAIHDPLVTGAVTIKQTVANTDFNVIFQIQTTPTGGTNNFSAVGILAYQDDSNYATANYQLTGTSAYNFLLQNTVASVTTSTTLSRGSGDTFPLWINFSRISNVFGAKLSSNGTSWTDVGGTQTAAFTVNSIRLAVDNYNNTAGSTVAYATKVNLFCNASGTTTPVCIPKTLFRSVTF